jgi:hypothetical protein
MRPPAARGREPSRERDCSRQPWTGDTEAAWWQPHLLVAREERDSGSVAQIYSAFLPAIEHVASHQGAQRHPLNCGAPGLTRW